MRGFSAATYLGAVKTGVVDSTGSTGGPLAILERLDKIEAQITPLAESFKGVNELKDDLSPLAHNAIKLVIKELEDVESSFQLEDLMEYLEHASGAE